ncbi:MAG: FmdB family zinc ribbon protein [Candidatus Geothermincolia bacterium]
MPSGSRIGGRELPIYEYRCSSCGTVFEYLERLEAAPLAACKECGSEDVARLFSTFASPRRSTARGRTCCGLEERCDSPACGDGGCCGSSRPTL